MTLTIHKEENDVRELQLKVEVSEDQVEKAMRKKARELGREIRFPGFRSGKVPYRVIIQRVGRNAVRADAVDDIVQTVFADAVQEAEVQPYGQPTLDNMEVEPLVFEFTVPLEPVVTLGEDYREMRHEVEPVVVTDEALQEALEQVQIQHQTTEPVDRPIQESDLVTVSGKGELVAVEAEDEETEEGDDPVDPQPELLFDQENLELVMDDKKLFPGTGFVAALIGCNVGDDAHFTINFPEDFEEEDLSGREANFELNVIEVQSRELPPMDDELAKLDGSYETLDEMRDALKKQLQQQAENQAKEDLIESTIDELLEDAEVIYPPAAVEMEIDEMVESFKNQVTRSGWEFEDYLTIQGSTEDALRDDFADNAAERLTRRLILRQLMLAEKLTVEFSDVEALVDERTADIDNEELQQNMKNFYLQGSGFEMISSEVLSNKVYERIQAILSGNAPDLDALEEDEDQSDASEEE